MFAQHASHGPILRECPDRRGGERFVHREPVQIDGRPVIGCDISDKGLAVVMRPPVTVGDVVRVTLAGDIGGAGTVTTPARVARVDARSGRFVVGLEFLQ